METIPQKVCTRCKQPSPAITEFFSPHKSTKTGLTSWCRQCAREYGRAYRRPEERRNYSRTEKKCSICKNIKPLTSFDKDTRKPDGRDCRCKQCRNMEKAARRRADPEWRRHSNDRIRSWRQPTGRTGDTQRDMFGPGYVYIIHSAGRYKIGLSASPQTRLPAIQSPFPIEIICLIPTDNMRLLEEQLHEQFNHVRKYGEWFELSDVDVKSIKHMAE